MELKSIKKVETEPVYDIQVEYAHHYILNNGIITHNSGLDYAASGVIFLSKKKIKDEDKKVTGVILTATLKKSRLTIENKSVETLLDYQTGLDPYYGLVDLAVAFGIWKYARKMITLQDGTEVHENDILESPEKYFTKKVLDEIDVLCKNEFLYGKTDFKKSKEGE